MSPALDGNSVIRHFKRSDVVEIRDGITFDFYTGLPHMYIPLVVSKRKGGEDAIEASCCLQLSYLQFLQLSVQILHGNGGWEQVGPGWLQSLDTVSKRAQLV